jgi:hypothetical protein
MLADNSQVAKFEVAYLRGWAGKGGKIDVQGEFCRSAKLSLKPETADAIEI